MGWCDTEREMVKASQQLGVPVPGRVVLLDINVAVKEAAGGLPMEKQRPDFEEQRWTLKS